MSLIIQSIESIKYDLLFKINDGNYGSYLAMICKNENKGKMLFEGNYFSPNWSNDGNFIILHKCSDYGEKILYIMNKDGSNIHVIGNGENPSFSPDDQKITFKWAENFRTEGMNTKIYTMDRYGSNRERITSTPLTHQNPSFSHDGKRILFDARPGIRAIDLETKEVKSLIKDGFSPFCSTIEPKFVFVRNGNVCTADLEGNNIVELQKGFSPKWSRDGEMIVFVDKKKSKDQIFIMDCNGKGRKQLTDAEYGCWDPAIY